MRYLLPQLTKEQIDELYNCYLMNVISLSSNIEIILINSNDIKIYDDIQKKQRDNPYLIDGDMIKLYNDIKNNGIHWIFILTHRKKQILEGNHRMFSIKQHNINIQFPSIAKIETDFKKTINIYDFETDNNEMNIFCKNATKSTHVYKTILNMSMFLRHYIYEYKDRFNEDFKGSLLCNDYECLNYAVEHYKKTGEFITDNKILSKFK